VTKANNNVSVKGQRCVVNHKGDIYRWCTVIISAPGGELLMVRVLAENDKTVRLEYTSQFTGTSATLTHSFV